MSREFLLKLDQEREKLELELKSLAEYLNSPGMPGLHGSLVDNDGFPHANIDHYRVREARQRFSILNNDHTALMNRIETELHNYHANIPPEDLEIRPPDRIPIPIGVPVEQRMPPFAFISEVADNSPAYEAGLRPNDEIIKFGQVTIQNHNNLQALAEEVRNSVNIPISVKIQRRNAVNERVDHNLTLVPRTWQGQGLVGCRFMPIHN